MITIFFESIFNAIIFVGVSGIVHLIWKRWKRYKDIKNYVCPECKGRLYIYNYQDLNEERINIFMKEKSNEPPSGLVYKSPISKKKKKKVWKYWKKGKKFNIISCLYNYGCMVFIIKKWKKEEIKRHEMK